MRYVSFSGINKEREVEKINSEKLLHEFYLKDTDGSNNWELSQSINMMNVSYTAKMDKFSGSYGSNTKGYAFEP